MKYQKFLLKIDMGAIVFALCLFAFLLGTKAANAQTFDFSCDDENFIAFKYEAPHFVANISDGTPFNRKAGDTEWYRVDWLYSITGEQGSFSKKYSSSDVSLVDTSIEVVYPDPGHYRAKLKKGGSLNETILSNIIEIAPGYTTLITLSITGLSLEGTTPVLKNLEDTPFWQDADKGDKLEFYSDITHLTKIWEETIDEAVDNNPNRSIRLESDSSYDFNWLQDIHDNATLYIVNVGQ